MKVSGFTSGGCRLITEDSQSKGWWPCLCFNKGHSSRKRAPFLAPSHAQPTHPCSPFCFTTLFIMCVWAQSNAKNNTDDNVVDDNNKKGGSEQEHWDGRVPPEPESSLSWQAEFYFPSRAQTRLRRIRADEATFTFHTLWEPSALYSQVCSNVTKHSFVCVMRGFFTFHEREVRS